MVCSIKCAMIEGVDLSNGDWQWMDGVLSSGEGGDFFEDEYRCPVYVKDVVQAIQLLMEKHFAGVQHPLHLLLNVGGPDRLSRAAMAETVANVQGYDTNLVRRVSSQTAVSVLRSTQILVMFHNPPLWSYPPCGVICKVSLSSFVA